MAVKTGPSERLNEEKATPMKDDAREKNEDLFYSKNKSFSTR